MRNPEHVEVADVLRRYGPAYQAAYGHTLSTAQRRAVKDLVCCRTAALGGHVEECDHCGHRRMAYNSCRNRHCPKCQAATRAQWLDDRAAALLPIEYYAHQSAMLSWLRRGSSALHFGSRDST